MLRRIILLFLLIVPLPFLSSMYQPGHLQGFIIAGVIQGGLIGVAAWVLVNQRRDGVAVTGRRESLVAAGLLIANWAVTSMALNMNAPPRGEAWLKTTLDQQFRYYALVVGGLVALGGLSALAARLRDAGEGMLSALGLTSAVVSQLLFTLLFLSLPYATTPRFNSEVHPGDVAQWWPAFAAVFHSMEIVQRVLLYFAMILFAASSWRTEILAPLPAISLISLTLLAGLANLAVHIPPAVPFVLPYLTGVFLLGQMGAGIRTRPGTS